MIFYPNSKICSYEIEYNIDCFDAEQQRVNSGWGEE